jgi:hypothetical protein
MSRVALLPLTLCTFICGLAYPASVLAQIAPPEIDLAFPTVNPCNSEAVAVQGFVDIDVHATEDPAGGTHCQKHVLSKGQGFGVEDRYTFSQEVNFEFNAAGPSTTEEATETLNHLLTSGGASPNFYLKLTLHVTLIDGAPVAEVVHADTDCRGGE